MSGFCPINLISHKTVQCVFQLRKKKTWLFDYLKKKIGRTLLLHNQIAEKDQHCPPSALIFFPRFPLATDQPTHFSDSSTYLSSISRSLPCQNSSLLWTSFPVSKENRLGSHITKCKGVFFLREDYYARTQTTGCAVHAKEHSLSWDAVIWCNNDVPLIHNGHCLHGLVLILTVLASLSQLPV